MQTITEAQESLLPELPRPSVWSTTHELCGTATSLTGSLNAELSVDVAIVGAGITGITAAAQLARAGRTVAVLEAGAVGCGASGHSTGNLYATVDERLHKLAAKWGDDTVSAVVQSRSAAIELIERNIAEHRIKCDFKREPWILYSTDGRPEEYDEIEAEYQAALAAGLDARMALDLPLPYMTRKAMVIANQAQFNPFRYVRQLAAAIQSQQCQIFEHSAVVEMEEDKGLLHTATHTVRADHIILATHTPKGFNVVQTELGPYREYAVAGRQLGNPLAGGIFWGLGIHPTSTRSVRIDGRQYVLMIGQKHKTGQKDDTDASYLHLEEMLRSRFDVSAVEFKWSAQQYRAADCLPYIGPSAASSSLYIATGFGTDGLTYGTLAGMMLADEICGVKNMFAELYSPSRFTPVKSARNFFKENLNVAGRYIKDYAQSPHLKKLSDVARGEGELVEIEGGKLAVYRDHSDQVHILSPVCTHLKCIVHWNRAECSWDCPCHGSRFSYDGNVIEGPALEPLQRHDTVADSAPPG